MLLKNKKVVVVGGSSGIGLSTAELARREGADVIIASRNVERLDAAAQSLNAIAIPADVTSDESVADLFHRAGPVDHVVVTAAQLRTGPRQRGVTRDYRYADPRGDAGRGAARHARQDCRRVAGRPRRGRGGHRAPDSGFHDHRLRDGIDRLSRRRSADHLTMQVMMQFRAVPLDGAGYAEAGYRRAWSGGACGCAIGRRAGTQPWLAHRHHAA